jgi:ABC-2 type transport system permease protein
VIGTIARASERGLLGRRRTLLIVLFAATPVVIAVLLRASGVTTDAVRLTVALLDNLVVRTVLPLVALVFGTGVLGSDLEDGTAVYVLVRPIARWRIVLANALVAGLLTSGLLVIVTLVAGMVAAAGRGAEQVVLAYVIAVAIGALLYTTVFLALSIVTGRALIVGLAYVLIWEGLLAGLLEGTQVLSIRQYTLAIAKALAGGDASAINVTLAGPVALVLSVVVLVGAFVVATRRLEAYEVRGTD